jgi:hypothetical protein
MDTQLLSVATNIKAPAAGQSTSIGCWEARSR